MSKHNPRKAAKRAGRKQPPSGGPEDVEHKPVTVAGILSELEAARRLAMRVKQPSAAVSASMGRAKVAGLIIEKSEQGRPGDFSAMMNDELGSFILSEQEDLRLVTSTPRQLSARRTKH